jgi:signal transduction histidine kinase
LVNAAANAHAARAQLRGVALDVSATAVTAWLDPMRVRQALDNLVDNALRHGVGAAAIAITASCRPPAVTIAVSDDGRGLGTAPTFGLGLRMVAAVAASHRGTFEIRNRPGGGTIAALVLPGARTEDPEAVSPQSCRILDR